MEALPLGKGALDMAGDDVLQAAIFTQGVGLEPLQDAEQGLLLARLGLELGDAVNLLGHRGLLAVSQPRRATTRLSMRRALPR
jgi:hypothetical protein